MSDDPKAEAGSFDRPSAPAHRWNGREASDPLDRECVQRLAFERGHCEVKTCGAVNVPFFVVRWDPTAKCISNTGVDKKVCYPCAERLAGRRP
jgi:hypothetical protein